MSRPLRVAIVGDGPAGLWLARRLHDHMGPGVAVWVQVRADAEPGLGIVLEHAVVERLDERVPGVGAAVVAGGAEWDRVTVRAGAEEVVARGHHIHGVERAHVRRVLLAAVHAAGVPTITHSLPPDAPPDLVVGADGAGSGVRAPLAARLGTQVRPSRALHTWVAVRGGDLAPGFVVVPDPDGYLMLHTYPFGPDRRTVVVEAAAATVGALGLAGVAGPALARLLTRLLASVAPGVVVEPVRRPFAPFRTVTHRRWSAGRTVLVGDAAHALHFSVGSGTAFAVEDAEVLARELAGAPSVPAALLRYERERAAALAPAQLDALASEEWFADVDQQQGRDPALLMFALRTRRDQTTYESLRRRVPAFVGRVVAALGGDRPPARPSALPLPTPGGTLPGRVLHTGPGPEAGVERLCAEEDGTVALLVAAPGALPAGSVARLRAGSGLPVGVRLPPGPDATGAPDAAGRDVEEWDFAVFAAEPTHPRILATVAAARWRAERRQVVGVEVPGDPDGDPSGRPGWSRDDIETLVAAGRLDFVIVTAGPAPVVTAEPTPSPGA